MLNIAFCIDFIKKYYNIQWRCMLSTSSRNAYVNITNDLASLKRKTFFWSIDLTSEDYSLVKTSSDE